MASSLDTSAFSAGVRRELAKIQLEAARAVRTAGEDAAETAKRLAPRDSSDMADSIESTPGTDAEGPYADVTVEPFYASFVEFGTSKMDAKPFMRPAVEQAASTNLRRRP